jgi:glutamate/tyrosine decarboxylase-like PLP-dependent enzyme
MDIRDRLEAIQRAPHPLEYTAQQRAELTRAVTYYAEAYRASIDSRPVYMPDRSDSDAALAIDEQPVSIEEALGTLALHVDSTGQNTVSSRFFAYIPSGAIYPGALGDYLAANSNRYAGVAYAGPGATRLERQVIRWLADELGYPETARGDLTSGGSIAALSAIVAAREAHDIRARDVEQTAIYQTSLTHHAMSKALKVAGLEDCPMRFVPLDQAYRMDTTALEGMIAADKEAGLRPWLIIASAGTTDLGTVDPLPRLADIAEEFGLWLQVDAAYGGGFVLCEEGKRRLAGIERSASLIMNPHKGLFLPTGIGMVLVRDGASLFQAYHARGTYMQDLEGAGPELELSACDFSPELTRPFRGLRVWLPLKLAGVGPFRDALEEKLLLAEYFYDRIRRIDGFVTGPPPDLSVVAFRYVPERGDADDFNRRLATAIRDDGRIFLSTTTLDDAYTLRMAILGYHTHLHDVDIALDVIEEKSRELAAE